LAGRGPPLAADLNGGEKALLIHSMRLISLSMLEKLHIQRDWATVLAFVFGAAVIVPSMMALLFSLGALARLLF
jgi:hypothetical protein